ncbi:zinc finger protein 430-like [Nematolebias whitei]|uniref:zinc finger protein 430-like n=1 Tax=Nematolebias whitei TaxID=451745 RepID=UPI001897DB1D|nr:zinc finger protein 430-like [Nematolebias whitei]
MSSVHLLREFIGERLSAAASEIFSEFEKTILRYEEELDRQRRLLDVSWKPELKLLRVDLQQEPVHNTELILTDQQLCNQERNSSLNQEEPEPPIIKEEHEELEPPQIKEEEQELCTNQEEDQLHAKQETDLFMVTEPDGEQLISQSSAEPEDQDSVCGTTFNTSADCKRHMMIHTGERPYSCQTCGKCFNRTSLLNRHKMIHTGEKPFFCETCGKRFHQFSHLNYHMRIHTGERPFICETCGKSFYQSSHLKYHMAIHTGERPFICETCGKRFYQTSHLNRHMMMHI